MKRLGVLATLSALAAGVYIAGASAIGHPMPPPPIRLAAAHSQPVAGRRFTGVTVTNLGTHIAWVRCAATVAHKDVPGRALRFYAEPKAYDPGPHLSVVTCSWPIPLHSAGKWLRATAYVGIGKNGQDAEGGSVASWRVRGSSALPKVHGSKAVGKRVRAGMPRLGPIIPRRVPPFIAYSYVNSQATLAGIFLIKPDGSDPHALSPNAANLVDGSPKVVWATEPSWSPNRKEILYTDNCIISVIDADGRHPRPLIPVGAPALGYDGCHVSRAQPSWSPDGKKIMYLYSPSGTGVIRIANADGSDDHRVPHTQGAVSPSFSPDGGYIVFSRYDSVFDPSTQQTVFSSRLYVIRPDGSGLHRIARGYGGEDPSWSPDGNRIIYSCSIYTNPVSIPPGAIGVAPTPVPHAICEISRADPKPRTLYSVPPGDYIAGQTWNANGTAILVTDDANQIELLSPSGGTPVEITHDGYNWAPSW